MAHDVAPSKKRPVYSVSMQLMLLVGFMQGYDCGVILNNALSPKATGVVVH